MPSLFGMAQCINWQNLDLGKDKLFGISTEKAYAELLRNKAAKKIIVAIIDSGIDTTHEDLKSVLWSQPINGSHGRNYMDYEKGKEDITNLACINKDFYDSLSYSIVPETYRMGYQAYRKISGEYNKHFEGMREFSVELKQALVLLDEITRTIGKDNPTVDDFKKYRPINEDETNILKLIIARLPDYSDFTTFKRREVLDLLKLAKYHLDHGLNMLPENDTNNDLPSRNDTTDVSSYALGLVNRENFTSYHGTHVAGIIGAIRNNDLGVNGVADNVSIMSLKVVSNVRELRDEDLAHAIYYAVNNGAKIINLSFGKRYTWNKKAVDAAVRFAMKKDVLIIHAAGNAGEDLDKVDHFPNAVYDDGSGRASAWIEVGASGWRDDSTLAAPFSNYGKLSVDVFAPGVQIRSTTPASHYDNWSGTSMAAPMVSGIATLIRGCYPELTAVQVKNIILMSVIKVHHNVTIKDSSGKLKSVPFSEICTSGGIANAYTALQLAATYKN